MCLYFLGPRSLAVSSVCVINVLNLLFPFHSFFCCLLSSFLPCSFFNFIAPSLFFLVSFPLFQFFLSVIFSLLSLFFFFFLPFLLFLRHCFFFVTSLPLSVSFLCYYQYIERHQTCEQPPLVFVQQGLNRLGRQDIWRN